MNEAEGWSGDSKEQEAGAEVAGKEGGGCWCQAVGGRAGGTGQGCDGWGREGGRDEWLAVERNGAEQHSTGVRARGRQKGVGAGEEEPRGRSRGEEEERTGAAGVRE